VDQVFATFSFPNTAPPCDNVVCNSNGDISGNELPRAPKFQAAMGVQYEQELSADTDFFIRADGSYQSRSFADTVNAAVIGDRFLANGRVGVNYRNFGLSIWGRNIFDKKYVSNSTQIIQRQGDNLLSRNFGDRRTIGATVSVKY
jgi:iron complex outermembrane receptor protein